MSIRYNYTANEAITSTTQMSVKSCQIKGDGTFGGVLFIDFNDTEFADELLESDDRFISYSRSK